MAYHVPSDCRMASQGIRNLSLFIVPLPENLPNISKSTGFGVFVECSVGSTWWQMAPQFIQCSFSRNWNALHCNLWPVHCIVVCFCVLCYPTQLTIDCGRLTLFHPSCGGGFFHSGTVPPNLRNWNWRHNGIMSCHPPLFWHSQTSQKCTFQLGTVKNLITLIAALLLF